MGRHRVLDHKIMAVITEAANAVIRHQNLRSDSQRCHRAHRPEILAQLPPYFANKDVSYRTLGSLIISTNCFPHFVWR